MALSRDWDAEKAKQAVQEFGYTFLWTFLLAFYAWASGLAALPNYGQVKAFFWAAGTSAALAAVKAVGWFFTGTKKEA